MGNILVRCFFVQPNNVLVGWKAKIRLIRSVQRLDVLSQIGGVLVYKELFVRFFCLGAVLIAFIE